MPKLHRALVTPSVLSWARVSLHFSAEAAAKKVHVSRELISSWETGEAQPTIRQARQLAELYRQQFAVFYLPQPPTLKIVTPRDYRRLAGTSIEGPSPAILVDVQESWRRRELILELAEKNLPSGRLPRSAIRIESDPESSSIAVRSLLRIDVNEQFKWRDNRVAFNGWRQSVERAGVLVFQANGIPLDELRGYSIVARPYPIVVVNRKDAPAGRTFTLIHEVVHILLERSGLCDLSSDEERPPEEQRVEVYCNAVAAAVLMPRDEILNHDLVKGNETKLSWSDPEIEELAKHFSVSREAILRRLLTLGKATSKFYEAKRAQFQAEYARRPKPKGFVTPAQNAISLLGKPYVKTVFDALSANKLTTSDASDYLGVRIKHFEKLLDLARGD